MAGLELFLDSSGIKRGADEAIKALDDLAAKAGQTQTVLGGLGNQAQRAGESFGGGGSGGGSSPAPSIPSTPAPAPSGGGGGGRAPRAPSPSGGGDGLAGRISGVAGALSGLRSISSATSFQHLAFEAGKLYDDFRGLQAGVGGTSTAFETLKAVMKAHPIFVITTVISAAAGLMSVLGSTTKATATEFDRLGQSMTKLRFDEEAAKLLGVSATGPQEARLRNILTGASAALENQDFSVGSIGSASQQGNIQVLRYLASQGDQRALEYLQTGRYKAAPGEGDRPGLNPLYWSDYSTDPTRLTLTRDQARDFLRRSYDFERGRLDETRASEQSTGGATSSISSILGSGPSPYRDEALYGTGYMLRPGGYDGSLERGGSGYSPAFSPGGFPFIDGAQQSEIQRAQEAADRAQAERLQRNMEMADQLGDAIGGALASGILGAQSMGRAFASLFAGFADQGIRAATRGLTSAVFGGFGTTGAQGGGTSAGTASTNPD